MAKLLRKIKNPPIIAPAPPEPAPKATRARKSKTDEDAAPAPLHVPGDELPIVGKPPPLIPDNRGKEELMRYHPEYTVTLDAGAFMWVWRIIESKARHHNAAGSFAKEFLPEQLDVALRAAQSMRHAAGAVEERMASIGSSDKKPKRLGRV